MVSMCMLSHSCPALCDPTGTCYYDVEEPEMCTEGPEEEVLVLSEWLLRFSFCVRKGELGIAIFCLAVTLK